MRKIDHLILNVNDIPQSIDFYVNVLGFTLHLIEIRTYE
jgi:catechol 2,3-dioxygenase-like lactoylglutathione lyase family enzyme